MYHTNELPLCSSGKLRLGDALMTYSHVPANGSLTLNEQDRPEVARLLGLNTSGYLNIEPVDISVLSKVRYIPDENLEEVELPEEPYWTYQFDGMKPEATTQDMTKELDRVRTLKDVDSIHSLYEGPKISLEGKKYTLGESAYILRHARGHYGACSGIGWLAVFARCRNIDIYWENDCDPEKHMQRVKNAWKTYGANLMIRKG